MGYYNRGGLIFNTNKLNPNDDLHLEGIGIITLNKKIKSAHLEGYFKINSEIKCDNIHLEGYTVCENGIIAKAFVKSEGRLIVNSIIRSPKIVLYGSIRCDELHSKETIFFINGNSNIKNIICRNINVIIKICDSNFKLLNKTPQIVIESIIASEKIDIISSICNEIEAPDVIVGKNCRIGKVKYTNSLTINDNAIVNVVEKI
jgi:hypothetical protein